MIKIDIPGTPKPLKRHRTNGKRTYDPSKEDKKVFAIQVKSRCTGLFPHSEPIKVSLEYHMPIPKSYSKKRQVKVLGGPHSKKPDATNLAKFTEDALNNILWEDDSLISELKIRKIYSQTPKTIIEVEKIK